MPVDNPLRVKSRPILDTGRVRGWIWGHEHRGMAYEPLPGLAYPRCVGHGGVPVYAPAQPTDPLPPGVIWEHRESFVAGVEIWARFGFAELDIDGPRISARYIDESGKPGLREEMV